MADELRGAWFKVIWAHQHVEELKRHVALYLNATPDTTAVYRQGDVTIVEAPRLYAPPHLDIQGIIGDALCAAMSSLDYIVWELAARHVGRDLKPPHLGGSDMPSFPLYNSKMRYEAATKPKALRTEYKFPSDVLAEIAAVQPFNAGYEPLWRLYILVNQDKHRLPLLVEGHIKHGDLTLSRGDVAYSKRASGASAVTFNTPLAVTPVHLSHEMKVNANIESKFVAFGDPSMPREPVEIVLHSIVACVEKVVGRFTRFFL